MKEIRAFKCSSGQIFECEKDAREHEFICLVRKAWGGFPSREDVGDPGTIAFLLVGGVYQGARRTLIEALAYLEAHFPEPKS